jgi:tight adherence protein B
MAETIITLLAFAAGFLGIFSINMVLTDLHERDQRDVRKRMDEELLARERQLARESVMSLRQHKDLSHLAAEAARETATSQNVLERLREMLGQSGLRWTPGQLLGSAAALASVVGVAGLLLTGYAWVGALLGGFAAGLPLLYVQSQRQRRLDQLRAQLPDCLDLMSRIMRAGQTITQAMHSVSQEFKPPVATEFEYCYEQQNLGLALDLALRDLARRTGLLEIKIFVMGLLVQRQIGGNLAELLDNLANIMRERFRIRGKIKSLTAEGRMQAVCLLVLPPATWLILLVVNRNYALKLLEHPQMIVGALVMMMLGAICIRKIINFDF